MQLFIDGKEAALPESTSFEYFEESVYFSEAQGYSLQIELPLKGCPANRRIFGNIERNPPKSAKWSARLICGQMVKHGIVLLTDVSAKTVKVQFLAGRSVDGSAEALETTYINELDFEDAIYVRNKLLLTPCSAQYTYDQIVKEKKYEGVFYERKSPDDWSQSFMELPAAVFQWYDENSGRTHNKMHVSAPFIHGESDPRFIIPSQHFGLSWMPYLLPLMSNIAKAMGYEFDISVFEDSKYRNLIVCNAVPALNIAPTHPGYISEDYAALYNCKKALPHWTVLELFDNVAPILNGFFEFDHLSKKIRFVSEESGDLPAVSLDSVEDEYEIASSYGMEDPDFNYVRSLPYRYAEQDVSFWKYLDYPNYLEATSSVRTIEVHGPSIKQVPDSLANEGGSWYNPRSCLFWNPDIQCAYAHILHAKPLYVTGITDTEDISITVTPVNVFGPEHYEKDIEYRELKVVPAVCFYHRVWMSPNGVEDPLELISEDDEKEKEYPYIFSWKRKDAFESLNVPKYDRDLIQTAVIEALDEGEEDTSSSPYDVLIVGYNPEIAERNPMYQTPVSLDFAIPTMSHSSIKTYDKEYSMRLGDVGFRPYSSLPKVNEAVAFTFYFHSPTMPDVNSIFYIHGHRYMCRRIEVSMSSRGLSSRMKGEFYPIVDE